MKRRMLEALGVAVVMMAVTVFLQGAASGQAPATGSSSSGAASATTGGDAAKAGPAGRTPWGHPDLQGIWLDEFDTPFERPAQNADKEFFTEDERKARDERITADAGRNERAGRGSTQDVAGAYNAVFTSAKPTARRTSLVVDPPNGRIPALTPEMQERTRIDREFRLALLQNTPTCKNGAPGCNGGKYGPPSPRFDDTPPFYNTQRMNRHNGPEDQSMGDRCMLGTTPDVNGFRRIVQGPNLVAIGVDTGQGQGYQRVVYLSGSHPPTRVRLRHGDSRGRFEGQTLVVETTNFSPEVPVSRGEREPDARRTVHAPRCEDARVLGDVDRPDGVDCAVDDQAGADGAERPAESDLLRAAMPRGQLRSGIAAHWCQARRQSVQGRERPEPGLERHGDLCERVAGRARELTKPPGHGGRIEDTAWRALSEAQQ